MPTYDYKCVSCSHRFEEFQSMKDDPLTICPACHKASLRRLLGTGAGLIFKGSGFYITDYKKNGDGKATNKEAGSKPESSGEKNTSKDSTNKSSDNKGDKKEAAV